MDLQDRSVEGIPLSEWRELAERIKTSGGKALILVHPFYTVIRESLPYYRTVYALLKRSKIPIVILESFDAIQRTADRLSSIGAKPVFFVATDSVDPRIMVSKGRFDSSMKPLFDRLQEAGLKSMIMGGMYSRLDQNDHIYQAEREMYPHLKIDKRKVVSSFDCVGFTYLKALKHGGFEKVRLAPNALYPEKPVREFNPLWRREARLRSLRNHIK